MILQIFLILIFLAILIYSFQQKKYSGLVSWILQLASMLGIVFAIFPNLSTRLANLLGVGRGADLTFYLFIPISLLLILHLNAKLRRQTIGTTELVREIALLRHRIEQIEDSGEDKTR